eukprot:2927750-Prymnesium_polylepis.1
MPPRCATAAPSDGAPPQAPESTPRTIPSDTPRTATSEMTPRDESGTLTITTQRSSGAPALKRRGSATPAPVVPEHWKRARWHYEVGRAEWSLGRMQETLAQLRRALELLSSPQVGRRPR